MLQQSGRSWKSKLLGIKQVIYSNVLGNTVVAHIVYYNLKSSLVAVLVHSFLLQVFRHQEEGHRTPMQILGDAEVTNQV